MIPFPIFPIHMPGFGWQSRLLDMMSWQLSPAIIILCFNGKGLLWFHQSVYLYNKMMSDNIWCTHTAIARHSLCDCTQEDSRYCPQNISLYLCPLYWKSLQNMKYCTTCAKMPFPIFSIHIPGSAARADSMSWQLSPAITILPIPQL